MADEEVDVVNASDDASCPILASAELFCDSCIQDGEELRAEGYCVDCGHHLCGECFKIHRKPQPSRHHQLLSKDAMPLTKATSMLKDECIDKCGVHKDEIMKYYCTDHDEVGCTVCVTLGHRTCDVEYIPTVAENLYDNDKYKSFKKSLKSLSTRVSTCSYIATTYVRSIISDTGRTIAEIDKQRKEVNNFFDELEREVKEELQQSASKNLTKIALLLSACNKLDEQIQQEHEDVNNKEEKGQKCRLFVDMILTKKEVLNEYEKEVFGIENDNKVEHISYMPSSEIKQMVCDPSAMLGTFLRLDSVVRVSESKADIYEVILLTNDELVAVNGSANCVVIVNIEQNQVINSLSFPSLPFGLTRISDREFAVWYDNKLGVCSTEGEVRQQRTIHCPDLRWPIVYSNNTFIGFTKSSPSCAVKIIDVQGNEIKPFQAEDGRKKITFRDPQYIAVNENNTLMYVSDNAARIVKCLTIDGEIEAEFQPKYKWQPGAVALSPDGTVYVCDSRNNNVHILTTDLKEVRVINVEMFGIKGPNGIAYCELSRKLFVGMGKSTSIVVLKL